MALFDSKSLMKFVMKTAPTFGRFLFYARDRYNHGMKRIAVIYHANCPDGFGAAWVAWKKFGSRADYFAVPPRMLPEAPLEDYREIYIFDNSFPAEITKTFALAGKRVLTIDHHASSESDVRKSPEYVFDMRHSGAVLAWNYFNQKLKLPKLLAYIEDNDLWKFKLPKSRAANNYIELYPFEFKAYELLAKQFATAKGFAKAAEEGAVIERYREELVDRIVKSAYHVDFLGHIVLAVNSQSLISAVGDRLARKHPFAVVWSEHGAYRRFSLRSRGPFDVSKLAAKFPPGGGHPKAAGFSLPASEPFPWKVIKHHTHGE